MQFVFGSEVDYVDGLQGAGFTVNNPNVVAACGCGSSFQVREDAAEQAAPRLDPGHAMPVITASGLTKRIGARTLFADLSFKLDRGERMTLAGPQRQRQDDPAADARRRGRRPTAAASRSAKGVRVALHDQRPPRGDATLRDYVAGGLAWIVEIEARARRARAADGRGRSDQATLDAYADAQARLEHAGGYRWRDGIGVALRGLGFDDAELDRPLATLLGRRADPGLARPGAGVEARPAAARRADQPPRHRVARVARGATSIEVDAAVDPGRPRPLVPGVGRHLGARARGGPGPVLRRALARVAHRAGRCASSPPGATPRAARPRSPAWSGSSSASATRRPRPARRSRS